MGEEVTVYIIAKFSELGGTSHYDEKVDFQTALLMMNSDVVTLNKRSYRVKYKEVNSQGDVTFYSVEIKPEDGEALRIDDIEK